MASWAIFSTLKLGPHLRAEGSEPGGLVAGDWSYSELSPASCPPWKGRLWERKFGFSNISGAHDLKQTRGMHFQTILFSVCS